MPAFADPGSVDVTLKQIPVDSLWAEQKYGDNGPEGIAGYRVANQVMVVIRDIDKVGEVLAAAIAAGANSIYGVQFSVADPASLEAEAREKALEDARQRAESLGGYGGGGFGGGGYGGGAMDSSTSISPGQLSYQSQVQVTFEIVE